MGVDVLVCRRTPTGGVLNGLTLPPQLMIN